MKLEHSQKKTIRYISIDQACEKFGSSLYNALPAFKAFTVYEYTASFKRKGKVTLLKLRFIRRCQTANVPEKYKQFSKTGSKNKTVLKIKKLDGSSGPSSAGYWSRK